MFSWRGSLDEFSVRLPGERREENLLELEAVQEAGVRELFRGLEQGYLLRVLQLHHPETH